MLKKVFSKKKESKGQQLIDKEVLDEKQFNVQETIMSRDVFRYTW